MEQEVLVQVEGLSKKFCKSLKKSLWYGVQDLVGSVMGKQPTATLRKDEFWALRDINFELRRGECLGLIGHNGAGKSTLLKILNGLINPDHGKVTLRGRVGALIDLGAGFNPILSGRENIYNNGAVLGFTKAEIDSKVEEIIDFAELREFIDMPVQNYSSGMKVRLGFAVAAQMEPDILIIDEVLAVGDIGFVLKCYALIDKLLPNTALIFVSHSMSMVSRICSNICLVNQGKTEFYGKNVAKGIDLYYSKFINSNSFEVFSSNEIELKGVRLLNSENGIVAWGGDIVIELNLIISNSEISPSITITVFDKEQRPVASLKKFTVDRQIKDLTQGFLLSITHKNNQLSKGIYTLSLTVNDGVTKSPLYRINNILSFQVTHEIDVYQPFYLDAHYELK